MSCLKNPKKFLFFKWLGDHSPVDDSVSRPFHDMYQVNRSCANCDVVLKDVWRSQNEMYHRGYDLQKINLMKAEPMGDPIPAKDLM